VFLHKSKGRKSDNLICGGTPWAGNQTIWAGNQTIVLPRNFEGVPPQIKNV